MALPPSILAALQARDAVEVAPFAALISTHLTLLQTLSHTAQASTATTSHTKSLESQIAQLQQELTLTYKKEAREATSQLALEAELRQLNTSLASQTAALDRTKEKLREALAHLDEETRVCAKAREETATLRDELLRVRRQLERSEGRVRELTKENDSLVERMLAEKARIAEELNRLAEVPVAATMPTSPVVLPGPPPPPTLKPYPSAMQLPPAVARADLPSKQPLSDAPKDSASMELVPSVLLFKFRAHESEVPNLRMDERGGLLATAGCDGSIGIWDALTGESKARMQAPQEDVAVLSVDIKLTHVLGAGSDRCARLWSLETGRLLHTFTGHTSKIYACRLTMDAKTGLTGGTDRKAMIWDCATGYRLRIISCGSICNAIAVGIEGAMFATGHQDRMVRLWDCRTGKLVSTIADVHDSAVTSVEFSGGGHLVTCSRDNSVCLIDMSLGKPLKRFTHPEFKVAFNWSAADCSPSRGLVAAPSADGKIYVWNCDTGKHVASLGGEGVHDVACSAVAWNPLGSGRLVSCDKNGVVAMWGAAR